MKRTITFLIGILALISIQAQTQQPWSHGRLMASPSGAYLQHADGTPFFWLGDTGWLLPQKLDRSEAAGYLQAAADAGFNVVQIQTLNGVPSYNVYGRPSHVHGWDFTGITQQGQGVEDGSSLQLTSADGAYGYWDHMDYIVQTAGRHGIYIGMVCIWGGLVKSGLMDAEQARTYGKFLADRYKDYPNIIWIIGGDIKGDVRPEVWEALATTIRANDPGHLMTFHPFGRTSSAYWWHDAEWLDMNMFQSGHRRYDQTKGDGDDTAAASVAEDNWRYVDDAIGRLPRKPVIDAEPSYEHIPQGLHDTTQPRWGAPDVRRYAYWSVFAGAAGHTYGHNSVMQMMKPGHASAYGAQKAWYEGINDEGYRQMKHLKRLMTAFPYFERVPDQSIIAGENGYRYDRAIATRGSDYLMVYTYTNRPMQIDLDRISGQRKHVWWFCPRTGAIEYAGTFDSATTTFAYNGAYGPGNDHVLIAADAERYNENLIIP